MKTNFSSTECEHPNPYRLTRGPGVWHLSFEGGQASFRHELGALYVACLLLEPPPEPLHAVALALKLRSLRAQHDTAAEAGADTLLGLDQAEAARALWRRQRDLERVLGDRQQIEPVKAEAQRELEEVVEALRRSPWRPWHCAERCARAVTQAIRRFHANLAAARDAAGQPDPVLQAFARHLKEHLLIPSRRGMEPTGPLMALPPGGFFTYEPPRLVVWQGSLKSEVSGLRGSLKPKVQRPKPEVQSPKAQTVGRPAEQNGHQECHVSRVTCQASLVTLCGVLALWSVTGCAGPRALKGGQAVTSRNAAGVLEQKLVQGENAAQPTAQEQSSLKLRTYTVPAGSQIADCGLRIAEWPNYVASLPRQSEAAADDPKSEIRNPKSDGSQLLPTLNHPLLLTEREETHTRTELGAAQKDTARELGAKLASLRGIVWVGVGLFVFGLASLVYPPLKLIIGSVTTSAALAAGGLALIILPSLIVGHELLILGVVSLAVGGWFLAHRHGALKAEVQSLKSKV